MWSLESVVAVKPSRRRGATCTDDFKKSRGMIQSETVFYSFLSGNANVDDYVQNATGKDASHADWYRAPATMDADSSTPRAD